MANEGQIKLTGFDELEKTLSELSLKVQKKVVRKAAKEGAKIQLDAAKQEAPKKTGQLAESLKIKTRFSKKNETLTAIVTTQDKDFTGDTYYAAFQEYGTKKLEANPYLERAFDRTKTEVLNKTMETLRAGIEKEAAKKS